MILNPWIVGQKRDVCPTLSVLFADLVPVIISTTGGGVGVGGRRWMCWGGGG